MACYDLKCTACAHRFSDVHPMSKPHPACPECSAPCDIDFERQGAPKMPAHDLHGTRSVSREIRFSAKTAARARKLFASSGRPEDVAAANCIRNGDGLVEFKHKDDAPKFFKRNQELRDIADARREVQKQERAAQKREHAIAVAKGLVAPASSLPATSAPRRRRAQNT